MSATSLSRALSVAATLSSAVLVVAALAPPAQARNDRGLGSAAPAAQPERGATLSKASKTRTSASAAVAAAAATGGCANVAIAPGSSPSGYLPLSLFSIAPISGVGDETLTSFTVPAFTYAGASHTTLAVSSNGYVKVGAATAADNTFLNQNLPDPAVPNNVLAPFWTDLNPNVAGELRIGSLTDGFDTWIVVDWAGVAEFSSPVNTHSFELWIGVEGDANPGQDISYAYGTTIGNGDGGFLTVGAENVNGSSGGSTYVDGTGSLPVSGTQLRVTSTPGLVAAFDATPTSGEEPLTVDFDASASTDDGSIASYDWDFGDGSTGTGATTSHEYANAGVYSATLTVTDDEANTCTATQQVSVTSAFSVDDVAVGEADGTATFTVTRNGGPAASVDVAAVAGSAESPADFTATGTTLSFAEGETSKTFAVTIAPDSIDEDDESYTVELSNPVNGSLGDASGLGSIVDDDAAPSLSVTDVNVLEGTKGVTTPMVFTVSLSGASGRTVAVTASTANGSAKSPSDYTKKTVLVTFAPGETSKTVTVNVKGDKAREGSEVFFLLISGATNATVADASGSGGILDDD